VTINGYAYRAQGAVIEVYAPRTARQSQGGRRFILPVEVRECGRPAHMLKDFVTKDIGRIEADINVNSLVVYDLPEAIEAISKWSSRLISRAAGHHISRDN